MGWTSWSRGNGSCYGRQGPDGPEDSVNAEHLDKVSAAISDLETALRAESCIVPVHQDTSVPELAWTMDKVSRKWRLMARTESRPWQPLCEMPALVRVDAYPLLESFGALVRKATTDRLRKAGVID